MKTCIYFQETFFCLTGLIDITRDPDYEHIYDKLPVDPPGDADMAEERRFFMQHADDMTLLMTLFQRRVKQHRNLFSFETDWTISSIVRLLEDQIDHTGQKTLLSENDSL